MTSADEYEMPDKAFPRELAAYLYSGVTAVKSVGDVLDEVLKDREMRRLGREAGRGIVRRRALVYRARRPWHRVQQEHSGGRARKFRRAVPAPAQDA